MCDGITVRMILGEGCMRSGHTGFWQDSYISLIDKTNRRIPTKLLSYIVIEHFFLFLDLDGLF